MVRRNRLDKIIGPDTYIPKGFGPSTARGSHSSILEIASDDTLLGEGGAEMTNVRQVIGGFPEPTVNYKQEWKLPSRILRKTQLRELIWALAIPDALVKWRWRSF